MLSKFSHQMVILFLAGCLYALGFPSLWMNSFFIGPIIGIATLSYFFSFRNSLKKKFMYLIIFSLGYGILGYWWLPHTYAVFGGLPTPLPQILWILTCPFLVIHLAVFLLLDHFLLAKKIKSSVFYQLSFAITLTLLENYIFQQFPAHIGHPWLILAPYLGLGKIFGAALFSFANFWLAINLSQTFKNRKWHLQPFSFWLFLLVLSPFFKIDFPTHSDRKLTTRLVQANIGSLLKVDSETGNPISQEKVISRYVELSTASLPSNTDLIVWPETALPKILDGQLMMTYSHYLPSVLRSLTQQTATDFFIGTYDQIKQENEDVYYETQLNTAAHIDRFGNLKNVYHKVKLIPFGETLPFGPLNQLLSRYITNISYFAQGERYPLFTTSSGISFTTAICYELLFTRFIRQYLNRFEKRPDLMINLTNDSWYGKTVEPYQHLFLAKWRAVEFGIPIIRSTNTGLTSVVYPNGLESARLPWYREDVLDITIPVPEGEKSIYQRYGFIPLILLWILLFIFLYFCEGKPALRRS